MASIKIRAKVDGDVTTVKALISHPMDTGLVKDKKTGKPIVGYVYNRATEQSGRPGYGYGYGSGAAIDEKKA